MAISLAEVNWLLHGGDGSDTGILLGAFALHIAHGVLDVSTELVLKEDLMELLQLTKLKHSLQLGHRSFQLRRVCLVTSKLARFIEALEVVIRGQSVLHQLNSEGIDLLAGVEDRLKLEPFDLVSDVVEELVLGHVNVIL